jgi:integrase
MPTLSTWNLDPTRILTRRELSTNVRRNLIIVRLGRCCGLRVSEISRLQLDDVVAEVQRPHLLLWRQITKGKRTRCVPLWWDAGTLADLVAWKARRVADSDV